MKRNRKEYIIETSIRHSIVTQFTSFVAIEEREKVSLGMRFESLEVFSEYLHFSGLRSKLNTNKSLPNSHTTHATDC